MIRHGNTNSETEQSEEPLIFDAQDGLTFYFYLPQNTPPSQVRQFGIVCGLPSHTGYLTQTDDPMDRTYKLRTDEDIPIQLWSSSPESLIQQATMAERQFAITGPHSPAIVLGQIPWSYFIYQHLILSTHLLEVPIQYDGAYVLPLTPIQSQGGVALQVALPPGEAYSPQFSGKFTTSGLLTTEKGRFFLTTPNPSFDTIAEYLQAIHLIFLQPDLRKKKRTLA